MDVYQRRRLVALGGVAVVLVIVVVAIASGGDGDEAPITTVTTDASEPTDAPQSKGDFIDDADAICAETASGLATIPTDDAERFASQELRLTQGELDQLRSLTPPERDQKTLDDFFAALEDLVDALQTKQLATDRADDTALAAANTEIDTAELELSSAADDYGFKECGSPSEAAPTEVPVDPGTATPPPATTPEATTPPATTPPADSGGGDGGGSGGVTPGGSGGVSP
jgi:hypothetical protein